MSHRKKAPVENPGKDAGLIFVVREDDIGDDYDMNWLQKLMSPREKSAATTKGKVPEGLWEKCEGCGAVL